MSDENKLDKGSLAEVIYHSLVDDFHLWVPTTDIRFSVQSVITNSGFYHKTNNYVLVRETSLIPNFSLWTAKILAFSACHCLQQQIPLTRLEKRAIRRGVRKRNKLAKQQAKKSNSAQNDEIRQEAVYHLLRGHEL